MRLSIVSDDPVQTSVLTGIAHRRGWTVGSFHHGDMGTTLDHPDAIIVDVEAVTDRVRVVLRALAERCGPERLVLLAEPPRESALGQIPPIGRLLMKPFHPTEFARSLDDVCVRPAAGR